jgi:hypothetical protein
MHIKQKSSLSLEREIHYHEQKVAQKQAVCLLAVNMLKEADQLTIREKQFFLERLQSLNDGVKRKTLQIFQSYHKDDVLDDNKMRKITREFMNEMDLGNQPYLVYRHWDTPHPHAHIVTTNIRPDGTRINLWGAEWLKSMRLARTLEQKYELYRAGQRIPDDEWARRYPAQKLVYGVTELKPTMNAILEAVLPNYKYTTLEELNMLLRPYQMKASRGKEDGVIYKRQGLIYILLNGQGQHENTYIKASTLRCKPTLRNLQQRFTENATLRETYRQRLTTAIDWIFYKQSVSEEAFRQALQKQKINIMQEESPKGGLRHIYYIDQLTKTVWDGGALGQRYSASGIRERCIPAENYQQQLQQQKLVQKQGLRQRLRPDLS